MCFASQSHAFSCRQETHDLLALVSFYGMLLKTSPNGLPLESVALISSKLWEDKDVIDEVYVVKGIYSSWREMLANYPMPQIVKATLIPFRDVIIYDGVIAPSGVYLGRNMSEQSKQTYLAAKSSGNLHDSL